MGLPLARRAREHEDLPAAIDADADRLVRSEPRVLDEERETDPDRTPLAACPSLLLGELLPADRVDGPAQALGIVAAVVPARPAVA